MKENKKINVQISSTSIEINDKTILRHICENCGKEELISVEEAFNEGWDYPPKMGKFRVISPRTCGNCTINTTLWWELEINKKSMDDLNEKQMETLIRIMNEPRSILP